MKNMHILYWNLYKGKRVFFGGCGMPDNDFLWSDQTQCHDTAEVKKTFTIFREIANAHASENLVRDPKFTDAFASSYAFVQTLGCGADFLKSNRARSHGVDWLESSVWLHQLAESSLDVDLDTLVRRTYWNDRKLVDSKCEGL
jgi:hypothetical protein